MSANLTFEERERIAYITGDAPLSELLDSAACVDAGWLSPEEADDLRKELEVANSETQDAEGSADTLRSELDDARDRIADLETLLRTGVVLAPLDSEEWANWAAEALEAIP